jgi:hypothetical protein
VRPEVQTGPLAPDPQQIIGDTVYNPETVKPLPATQCRIPIPKPTFFIVGGAKCGSTSLTSVLAGHPDCCHSAPKETNFFTLNFDQGWDWYRGTFAHYNGESVIGEASVSYGAIPFRRNVVEQLFQYNPDAKIVYITRNPYHKLVSGWKMATSGPGFLAHKSAMRGFEAYVLHEEKRHAEGGQWQNPTHGWIAAERSSESMTRVWLDALYFEGQIQNYLRLFPPEQLKVLFLEDWKRSFRSEAESLCEFLGLDPSRLVGPGAAINRADERKQVLSFYKFIADSKWLEPVRHLFPKSIRRPIRSAWYNSRFGSRKLTYPEFRVSDRFKRDLIRYLKAKSASFLALHNKPENFWDVDEPS